MYGDRVFSLGWPATFKTVFRDVCPFGIFFFARFVGLHRLSGGSVVGCVGELLDSQVSAQERQPPLSFHKPRGREGLVGIPRHGVLAGGVFTSKYEVVVVWVRSHCEMSLLGTALKWKRLIGC